MAKSLNIYLPQFRETQMRPLRDQQPRLRPEHLYVSSIQRK